MSRRLVAALEDLKTIAPADRQPPLERQLRLLTAAVRRHYDDEEDIRAALTAGAQGIGSGADLDGSDDAEKADNEPREGDTGEAPRSST